MSFSDLQNLVQALGKAEKSRFKEYCDENAHYAQLYEDLKAFPKLDEAAFQEKFSRKGYLKNFSYNKNYLFQTILDAVRTQKKRKGQDKPVSQQVGELLVDAEFLHDKKLYDLAGRQLQLAEKKAEQHELWEDLLKIYRFQMRIVMARQEKGFADKEREIMEKCRNLCRLLEQQYRLLDLRHHLFVLARTTPESRQRDQKEELEEIRRDELLQEVEQVTGFDAKLNFHFCHALLAQMERDLPTAYQHHQQMYQLWLAHPDFQKSRRRGFRNALNNYLLLACSTDQYGDFVPAVKLMEEGPFLTEDEEAEVVNNGMYVRLQYFMSLGKWEDAETIESDFGKKINVLADQILPSRAVAFYLSFARLNLVVGNWKKAFRWATRVLDMESREVRQDLRRQALLLTLVFFYENGEHDHLANRIRVAKRAFSPSKAPHAFETGFLLAMQELERKGEADSRWFEEKCNKLKDLPTDSELNQLGFKYLLTWMKAKGLGQELKGLFDQQGEAGGQDPTTSE